MPKYQLQTSRQKEIFLSVGAIVLVAIGAPKLLTIALPQDNQEPQPLVLESTLDDFSFPVEEIECVRTTDVTSMQGWECDDVTVQVTVADSPKDPTLALQRAFRGFLMQVTKVPDAPVRLDEKTDTRIMVDDQSSTVGLSAPGEGEQGKSYFEVLITGPGKSTAKVSTQVWEALSNGAKLPAGTKEDLAELPIGVATNPTASTKERPKL